jgi:hypothetical protein
MTPRSDRVLAILAALILTFALPCSSCFKYKRAAASSSNPEVLITDFNCMMGSAIPPGAVPPAFSITGTAQNVGAEPLRDVELSLYGGPIRAPSSNKTLLALSFTPEAQIFLPHQLNPGSKVSFQVAGTLWANLPAEVKDGAYLGRVSMMVTVPGRGSLKFATAKDHGYQLDFPVYLNRRLRAAPAPAECNGKVLSRPSPSNWFVGKCYAISGVIFRWISPTEALLRGQDKDNPPLVEFSEPPEARLGMNPTIVLDEGTYAYSNEFGVSNPVPRLKALKTVSTFTAASEPAAAAAAAAETRKCSSPVVFYVPGTVFARQFCLPISTFTNGSVSAAKKLPDTRKASYHLPYLPDRTPLTVTGFYNRSTGAKVARIDLTSSSLDIFGQAETLDGAIYFVPWKYLGGQIASIRGQAAVGCDALPAARPRTTGCVLNAYRMCVDLADKMGRTWLVGGGDQEMMIEGRLIRFRCIADATKAHGIGQACIVSGEQALAAAAATGRLGAARDRLVKRNYLECR